MQMNTKLFLQICLHLYGTRRQVSLVIMHVTGDCRNVSLFAMHLGDESKNVILFYLSNCCLVCYNRYMYNGIA